MYLFKFSIILVLISSSAFAARFSDMDCIRNNFTTQVVHKGQPMGLAENKLKLEKEQCVLRVSHEKMRFIKNYWVIDVCREPVHIKKGSGAVEILKREGPCDGSGGNAFCGAVKNITKIIQDDGLIFAKGEKEVLSTEHGRVYCSYLLLKSYLGRGLVFSRHKTYNNVLEPQNSSMGSQPAKQYNNMGTDKSEPQSMQKSSKALYDF